MASLAHPNEITIQADDTAIRSLEVIKAAQQC
jgi:hypothetical protein